jgi:hypothetical protein
VVHTNVRPPAELRDPHSKMMSKCSTITHRKSERHTDYDTARHQVQTAHAVQQATIAQDHPDTHCTEHTLLAGHSQMARSRI